MPVDKVDHAFVQRYINDANSAIKFEKYGTDPVGVLITYSGWYRELFPLLKKYIVDFGNEVQIKDPAFIDYKWIMYTAANNDVLFTRFNDNNSGWIQKTSWDNIDFDDNGNIIFKGVDKYGLG